MNKKTGLTTLLLCAMPMYVFASSGGGLTDRMMLLALQVGVILFVARLGNIVFEKFNMPGVLGELCSGMVIGPYALGGLPIMGFHNGLFPLGENFPVSAELYGLCAVASIVLLFLVGLETDFKLFVRFSVAGTVVGLCGVGISFILGDLTAMAFSKMIFGKQLGFLDPSCLFLGIISTATSVGITARILSEQKKLDSPEGVTILAGAVIDDVLGIIFLAIILGMITASESSGAIDWGHIGMIAFKAIGIWLAATAIGLFFARKISNLLKSFKDRWTIAILGLGMAHILAGFFEKAGLAMIIGSYVMGLSLSQTDISHLLREKLHGIYLLLVPVFFCVMGMLVDFRVLNSGPVLIFGTVYTLIAILAKVVGCGLPVMLLNFNFRGAMRIGFGMLPRGEIALIIAGIGLAKGVLNSEVVGVSILMMLITTMLAPPVLIKLFGDNTSGTKVKLDDDKNFILPFKFPSCEITELLVRKIVNAFEKEGFFAYYLSHDQGLYQLRKDEIVIGFSHVEEEIIFDCHEDEAALVHTAMTEVIADLERTIEGLKKPIDRKSIALKMSQVKSKSKNGNGPNKIQWSDYILKDALIPSLKSDTKEGVIEELIEILDKEGKVKNLAEAKEAVLVREKSMSTGMQHGIAIPHGRTDAVENLICAIGLHKEGIDFKSLDGLPSKIFILTLCPEEGALPYMQYMSTVSQALDEKGRNFLLKCDTQDEMMIVLSQM